MRNIKKQPVLMIHVYCNYDMYIVILIIYERIIKQMDLNYLFKLANKNIRKANINTCICLF